MNLKLSRRDRRALLSGVACASVVAAYALVARPLASSATELRQRHEAATEYLSRYRSILAGQVAYEVAADTARARLARLLPRTFGDARAGGAVTALLQTVERAASASLVRVVRVNPFAPDSIREGLVRIGAGVECESDFAGLLSFLATLEQDERLLHVSGLRVTSVRPAGSAPDAVETLGFSLIVSGFAVVEMLGDTTYAQTDR